MNRLHTSGLTDHHCHCDYSIDAVGTIDDYCRAAVDKGLASLCFTTHFDTNPRGDGKDNFIRVGGKDLPTNAVNLKPYVDDVLASAEQYLEHGLLVRLGIEIGWYEGCEETVLRLKERYDFDHVLCGIHELSDICFCCSHSFERCFASFDDSAAMVEAYFRQVVEAARTGLFDAIAHFDYYRKYGLRYFGPDLDSAFKPFVKDLASELKASHTPLEINTAGLRKGLDTWFPTPALLTALKREGTDVLYLGSDAHRPEDVGFDFDAAVNLLSESPVVCEL
jgi:histidinol-phosphatase (PHP family)